MNKRQKYLGLENDCFNHAIWIYDRLYQNSKPVDIAFLGSSHTINGINDKLIEEKLKSYNLTVVNFGYCRLGRNLTFVLVKEIIKTKKPKYLVIEISKGEDRYSHPVFPHIAGTFDVISANPFFNRDLLADIHTHLSYKIELLQEILFKNKSVVPARTSDFGFASSADTIAMKNLEKAKTERSKPKSELNKIEQVFFMSYPKIYFKKIHRLCRKNNIEMIFLYIPPYGTIQFVPNEYNTYIRYGKVILPPATLFDNPNNWHDDEHLNQNGANEFSLYLANEFKTLLSEKK